MLKRIVYPISINVFVISFFTLGWREIQLYSENKVLKYNNLFLSKTGNPLTGESVAKMLKEGRVYSEIVDKTGASTATISRVNRSLSEDYDSCGGYVLVFNRLEGKK